MVGLVCRSMIRRQDQRFMDSTWARLERGLGRDRQRSCAIPTGVAARCNEPHVMLAMHSVMAKAPEVGRAKSEPGFEKHRVGAQVRQS